MPREKKADIIKRGKKILEILRDKYGDAGTALRYDSPWKLLVATILSAQATDEKVNEVTPELFEAYPTIEDMAEADREDLEELVHPTGFYRNKARAIHESAQKIIEDFGGEVPETIEELTQLRGVARKTANVVLQEAINPEGPHEGVVVDTHVKRLSKRMGLVPSTWDNTDKIEKRLMELFPNEDWDLSFVFIRHGREICTARSPDCDACPILDLCPRRGVD
ncbi:MAG: endonuclease III [Armatimonadota bacterium]